MWLPKGGNNGERKEGGKKLVAVAIDKSKASQHALKWTVENLLTRGQTVVLLHVIHKPSSTSHHAAVHDANTHAHHDKLTKELFLTFHCFCTRKDVQCLDVILEDTDVGKALTEYVSYSAIEKLVLGASSRHGFFRRFKVSDVPSNVSKGVPDFCTVYVIYKGKMSSVRNASRSAPFTSPLYDQIQEKFNSQTSPANSRTRRSLSIKAPDRTPRKPQNFHEDTETFRSPFLRGRGGLNARLYGDMSESDTDISFVSSGRPSTDRTSALLYDSSIDSGRTSNVSATGSNNSFGSSGYYGGKPTDMSSLYEFSSVSIDSGRTSSSSQNADEVEAEMRRLKLELRKTMDLYSTACKEALSAKEKAVELHRWRIEEERRLEEARVTEEAALELAEKEKAKCRVAMETAEAARRIAQLESQRRINAEIKALNDSEERVVSSSVVVPTTTLSQNPNLRYKRYTIDEIEEATEFFAQARKIGEGGYGPVFKCLLDHTPVAVKVLRPDAAQGKSQFQQEVEVLSCMRHPNMVLLLGACPEYGCLVYEYMANGSLDDRLLRRGNTPALPWQLRFRIAAEIATGLLFLHQTKPEPLVHRDLKPANILLDHNYVSKISDVGLARLVPPSVADDVTQLRMTSTAGTFCYIDPEYQQTGMLGVKSDVYSFGVMLLQLITAKPAMGLTHHVGRSIEKGTFAEILDKAVEDWPVEEALCFAKLALQCAELRRKDRPDLGKEVLPELNRLRALGEKNMTPQCFQLLVAGGGGASAISTPNHCEVSSMVKQDALSDPLHS